ncbi:Membrin-11 [Acorus calamus]|uniref:Membrin n=1 Tax=Acorus calamus TaxID=4465 RepID=A0AAV9D5K9_ACOCL|nr:Membrin-11 [Acorus calamus]
MEGGVGVGGGGATISDMYQRSKKLSIQIRDGLERLEPSPSIVADAPPPELSFSIKRDIAQFQSLCADMDRLCRSIASKGHRDLWKRKIEVAAEEADSLKKNLDSYLLRHQKRLMEAKERAELLERMNGDSSHILRIFDDEAQAMQSARNSRVMIDEAYNTGVAILSKYAEQRDRLKRAQRKALDVLNTVGLSNSVLKLIERRHRLDKWIVYVGMVFTVVAVYVFWRLTH